MKSKGTYWFIILMIWPIIINSQPGTTFVLVGIDWKADDLDNTLFWVGITMGIIFGLAQVVGEERQKKKLQI